MMIIRSRRLSVRRPMPTTPASAIPAPITPERFLRERAIGIKVIRAFKVDGIEFATQHKLFQIDHLRAFDVERLQFLGGEGHELAAIIFVAFDDLGLIDLLTRSRIMRPNRDPGDGLALSYVTAAIVPVKVRCQQLGNILVSPLLRRRSG